MAAHPGRGRGLDNANSASSARAPFSEATKHAARVFGIALDGPAALPVPKPHAGALRALRSLRAGEIAAIVGPSGAGKSLLLRALATGARRRIIVTPERAADARDARSRRRAAARQTVLDLTIRAMRGRTGSAHSAERAMTLLARFGLADARLFVAPSSTRARALSIGERARLDLALAFARAAGRRRATIVCDEFLASLDAHTAAMVAASLRNAMRAPAARGASLIVATGREDALRALAPNVIIRLGFGGACEIERPRPRRAWRPRLRIERGAFADYAALAPLHYRAGRPASIVRVLRATAATPAGNRSRARRTLAGALVVSMPTLNAPPEARRGVAPDGLSRASRARALNRGVRCLSRAIVDPRFRALGVATALVRAYLRAPLTARTEALAAMGERCPFFRRAGMRAVRLPPRAPDVKLLRVLARVGVHERDLATPALAWSRLARQSLRNKREVKRALRAWAMRRGRSQAKWRRAPARLVFLRACASIRAETTAYIHESIRTGGK